MSFAPLPSDMELFDLITMSSSEIGPPRRRLPWREWGKRKGLRIRDDNLHADFPAPDGPINRILSVGRASSEAIWLDGEPTGPSGSNEGG